MKIAYNPKTAAALTTAPANNDITFDLSGLSIYVKGVRFKGTDTTYSVFKKHGSSGGGYDGLVPVPDYNNDSKNRLLKEDGNWTDDYVTLTTVQYIAGKKTISSQMDITNGDVNDDNSQYVRPVIYMDDSKNMIYSDTKANTIIRGSSIKFQLSNDSDSLLLDTSSLKSALPIISTQSITGTTLVSTTTDAAPLSVASTTKCTNLNADLLDGLHNGQVTAAMLKVIDTRGTQETPSSLHQGLEMYFKEKAILGLSVGSTYTGLLSFRPWGELTDFTGGPVYQISFVETPSLFIRTGDGNGWSPWTQIANTTSNVASATKLQTARTLWGQSFDGTANVDGSLHIYSTGDNWNEGIRMHVASNNWCGLVMCGSDNTGAAGTSANTWSIHNNDGKFYINRNGSSNSTGNELCNVDGNWGIGTVSPSHKLHVGGNIYTTAGIISRWAFINTGDSTLKVYDGKITDGYSDGNICLQTSIDKTDGQSHSHPTQYGSRCNLVLQPRGGQVYIGTNPNSGDTQYKLYVNGKAYLTGGTINGRLLVNYNVGHSTPAIAINYYDSYTINDTSIAQIKMGTPTYDAYLGLSPASRSKFGKVGYFMHIGSNYEFLWATSDWRKLMALECSTGNLWVNGSVTAAQFISTIATGTKPIDVVSTTLCNNLNADMLDGIHYQNILERRQSGYSHTTGTPGWFRIGETKGANNNGICFLLFLYRSYGYSNNEAYIFSISIAWDGSINITQISGIANNRLITKIRIDYPVNKTAYIDIYANDTTVANDYYWTTIGAAKSYTSWTANPTLAGTAYEFTTVNGTKSDKGFTGNLSGNASSASRLAYKDFDFTDGTDVATWTKNVSTTRQAGNWFSASGWAWAQSRYLNVGGSRLDRMRYSALSIREGNLTNDWQQQAILFIPTYSDSSIIYLAQMTTAGTAGSVSTSVKCYGDVEYNDGRYVNVTGDTMTGKLTINSSGGGNQLAINNTSGGESYFFLKSAGVDKGAFTTMQPTYGTCIFDATSNRYLGIKTDGTPHFQGNPLWHAGGGVWNPGANIRLGATANNQEWSFDISRNGFTGCYWHVWDSTLSTMLKVNADNGKVYAPYGFVGNLSGTATNADMLDGYHASSFAKSGIDYLSFTTTVAYKQWNRVANVKAINDGDGVSFIITIGTHHNSTVNNVTFFCSASFGGRISIREFSGANLSNISIRVSGENYPDTAYIELMSNSSYTSTGQVYRVKIIGLLCASISENYVANSSPATYYKTATSNIAGAITTEGNMYAAHFYENSDIRYKRVLNNLTASSRQLASLPLFDFEWIDGNILGTGTSAQEVQKILPNIVDGEEKLTLDYGVLGTISGVIACREIEEIKPEIEVLKQRIKELENQLNKH